MKDYALKTKIIYMLVTLIFFTTVSVYAGTRTLIMEEQEKKDFEAGINYLIKNYVGEDIPFIQKMYYEQKFKLLPFEKDKTLYYKAREYVAAHRGEVYRYSIKKEELNPDAEKLITYSRTVYNEENNCWEGESYTEYYPENQYQDNFAVYRDMVAREIALGILEDAVNDSTAVRIKINMAFPSGELVQLFEVTGDKNQLIFTVAE